MNLITEIQKAFTSYLQASFATVPAAEIDHAAHLTLNTDESRQAFGDLSSSAAMMLGKRLSTPPFTVAKQIVDGFTNAHISRIEIAGPGFINIFLTPTALVTLAEQLYDQKEAFFKLDAKTPKKKISIEFVSANPTGPLHLGHGRGGIIGDVLGNVCSFLGHTVVKEYYINDAGTQMEKLGLSLKVRCQQELGMDATLPEEGYQGAYLIDVARECIAQYGKAVIGEPDEFFQAYGKERMLANIKHTLTAYGINFDVWFSEKTLHEDGSLEKTLATLRAKNVLYEKDGALWLRSTDYTDDKDRVLRKSSGEFTYAASDSAYLQNKANRGFNLMIMVLGADHHGYSNRLEAIRQALEIAAPLNIIFYQLVKMKEGGQQVRMSKRTGNIVTLEGVTEMVGRDVARFFYLNRKADAQLDFDLDLALKKTEENPVYYAQYAYVRTQSILAKAAEEQALQDLKRSDASALGIDEALLIRKMASLATMLETISTNYQTHLLSYYTLELAQVFHGYYAKHRVIDLAHIEQSRARLLLIIMLKNTFETAFKLLGISCPEKM